MGIVIPPIRPPPPEPPPGCDIPLFQTTGLSSWSATNICEDPGCLSVCTTYTGTQLWLFISDCPDCIWAVYTLSSCGCVWDPSTGYFSVNCLYLFAGCVTNYGEQLPPPDPSPTEAFTLANLYGLNPPRKSRGGKLRYTNEGKFEPDRNNTAETRTMILASYIDKTNILIKYRPADLEAPP